MKRIAGVLAVAALVAGAAIGQARIDVLEAALVEKARGDEAAFVAALRKTVTEETSLTNAEKVAFVEKLLTNLGLEPELIAETAAVKERQELYEEWTERFEPTFTIGGEAVDAKTIIKALVPKAPPAEP